MSAFGRFKVPSQIKKRKLDHGLPVFKWSLLENMEEIGSGSYGVVYSANYENNAVVVKKLKGESSVAKDRFLKEAKLLFEMKHPNIPMFAGFMLLPVTASSCGITSVPSPILTVMFDKANHLLQVSSNVVPKPGATDGSFIVAGYGNTIHVVTPGKEGSLKCDRACVNFSTSVCEHVLAVAQVRGTFKEFLNWYRKSKKGPRVLEMALGSGPKNAGKNQADAKGRIRKRQK